ncbi:MAG: deoxyribose-phosphate aldolase [Bacilli bacterium]|nr:deoxyribose-phosphate aldolase [Bacilli bacterium]
MEIGKYIDHTNLKMDATSEHIAKLCREATEYNFETVCVHPCYVGLAKELLEGTNVGVCCVVGFPLGMNTPKVKSFEAIDAVENGADEIDMVINVGALKDKDYEYVKAEIEEIRDSIDGKVLKVIIETSLLTSDEIIKMTEICNETFVNYIKTSTGFGSRGASVEDVKLINEHRNEVLEIKASGGIKTYEQMNELINAGATRIGTSSGVSIVTNIHECGCDDCHCDNCECEEE